MSLRDEFNGIMSYSGFKRIPLWFFGTWPETRERWINEGWDPNGAVYGGGSGGPRLDFMDTDWETSFCGEGSIWNNQGLLKPAAVGDVKYEVLEERSESTVVRTATGGILEVSKTGSSISRHIEPDLKPERKDWERFKKYLNPDDPSRVFPEFEARAKSLASREHMTCFLGGSLFGWMFNWLGLEAVSCLPYDDPALYEEIISYMADYFMRLNSKFLGKVNFDFAYFFEDCCFNTGPMISPDIYRRFYDRHYRRMFEFYRSKGVKWMLVDSDGKVDDLIPCWLDSGFDIVFPIEIGAWKADPRELRKKYGRSLRMMGGVNKHVIAKGEGAVRSELEALRPLAEEGGFVPMPDHRIPPEVSLGQMRIYADIFRETFKFEAKS